MSQPADVSRLWWPGQAEISDVSRDAYIEVADFWQPVFIDTYPNGRQVTKELFEGQDVHDRMGERLRRDLSTPGVHLRATRHGGAILGTIGFGQEHYRPGYGYIWGFYVDTRLQGQGIGRTLWQDAMERVSQLELSEVSLLVVADSHKAIEFYSRNGFEVTGSEVRAWPAWVEEPVQNEILTMSRRF